MKIHKCTQQVVVILSVISQNQKVTGLISFRIVTVVTNTVNCELTFQYATRNL